MSAAGSDSGSLPGPIKRRRRRRSRGLMPSRNWARVEDFLNEIHDDETDHKGLQQRDRS